MFRFMNNRYNTSNDTNISNERYYQQRKPKLHISTSNDDGNNFNFLNYKVATYQTTSVWKELLKDYHSKLI